MAIKRWASGLNSFFGEKAYVLWKLNTLKWPSKPYGWLILGRIPKKYTYIHYCDSPCE